MIDPSIKKITEICEREDCRIEIGMMTSTLMSGSQYYDKAGVLHTNDPNSYYTDMKCISCGKQWEETRHQDKVTTRRIL